MGSSVWRKTHECPPIAIGSSPSQATAVHTSTMFSLVVVMTRSPGSAFLNVAARAGLTKDLVVVVDVP